MKYFAVCLTILAVMLGGCRMSRAALPAGARAPEFIGSADDWINSAPLTWDQLCGKVVLVNFMEYTCVNCIRTFPYLKAWHERYAPDGLVIVGIHTPEFGFATQKANVEAAVKRFGLTYPILNDPQSKNWNAYHESSWPSRYLFNQQGVLVEQHTGEGDYQQTERRIQQLLLTTHPEAKFPPPLTAVRPGDVRGAVCRAKTGELYANPTYGFLGNLPIKWQRDQVVTFRNSGKHADGKIYASGPFYPRDQSLQHARTTDNLADYLLIRYHGTEVNTVVNRPNGRDYRVYVTLDEKPVPQHDKGDDLQYDARGSYFEVTSPRMYNIYRGADGAHELKLASDSPDFDLYTFTFSGCPQR